MTSSFGFGSVFASVRSGQPCQGAIVRRLPRDRSRASAHRRDRHPDAARLARLPGRRAEDLKPGGRFFLVEYGTARGNTWVPHPISYRTWTTLAAEAGFRDTRLLTTVPSGFLGSIYSAVSVAP
jgi:hypothetical protein